MAATVFLRAGRKRVSLDVLARNTPISVEEFCSFIRTVENTVGVHAALVALRGQIDQCFYDTLSHTFIGNRLVHYKGQPKFGVFFCVTEVW
jgi:hypothetical protein